MIHNPKFAFSLSQATIVIIIPITTSLTTTTTITMVLSWIIKTLDRKLIITHMIWFQRADGVSILLQIMTSLNPKYVHV